MNVSVMQWMCLNIEKEDIFNKKIIEVGSQNINETLRPLIMNYLPNENVGVDIAKREKVELVVDASKLERYLSPSLLTYLYQQRC
ncbi:MAG: hypothetical protein QXU18_14550 [Thermoplasmatales archaeon]